MIHHIDFAVTDFDRSRAFYIAALTPLGLSIVIDHWKDRKLTGFGRSPDPEFWIRQGDPIGHLHVAFQAETRGAVDAFHVAAIKQEGRIVGHRVCESGMGRTTTPLSFSIRTGTTLRPCVAVHDALLQRKLTSRESLTIAKSAGSPPLSRHTLSALRPALTWQEHHPRRDCGCRISG